MFENYVGAKTQKRRTGATILVSVSVTLHVIAVAALLIRGFWVIDKLAPPKGDIAIAVAPPPPPPPPPPKASKKKQKPKTDKKVVKRIKPKVLTQTVEKPEELDVEVEIIDEDEGVEGGVEGGEIGGVLGGVVGGTLEGLPGGKLDAPPPPPAKPKLVAPQVVRGLRQSGEDQISPDDTTKMKMQRDGLNQVIATIKMCLSARGTVTSLSVLKSSGYPSYDRKIQSKMRQWRYKPYRADGKPVPVCTPVTFIYRQ